MKINVNIIKLIIENIVIKIILLIIGKIGDILKNQSNSVSPIINIIVSIIAKENREFDS